MVSALMVMNRIEKTGEVDRTKCEKQTMSSSSSSSSSTKPLQSSNSRPRPEWKENSYPNLTRHGKNSLLRKYLTPEVYEQLKDKKTSNGVTLENIIQGGVCLPYGANPPHGVGGVYAGDAESYITFAPLLNPIIETHHKSNVHSAFGLQRFQTNLNPGGLIQHVLDSKGEYILYTRMRLCRSVDGFAFAPTITRAERREIERLVKDCTSDWPGSYRSVMDMTNSEHDELLRKRLLFKEPNEYLISAGIARDWPDGRGIYSDNFDAPNLMIWCNARDHIGIISNAKGGDVQGVFTRMSQAAIRLEKNLMDRGHVFAEDRRLGFLNSSPSDIGPALRASVSIKLVRLGRCKGFHNLLQRLRLDVRADYTQTPGNNDKQYTGIFDIGNSETLGKSEVQLINIMIKGVAVCIELERRLENGEHLDLDKIDVEGIM